MTERTTVSKLTIIDWSPEPKSAAAKAALAHNHYMPAKASIVVSGASAALCNALRRTIACELLTHALEAAPEDITTDDAFVIPEMITKRLRAIPIDQHVDTGAVFELYAENPSATPLDVKMTLLKSHKHTKRPVCNGGFTLLTLQPGKYIKIKNITVHSDYAYRSGYGAMTPACNVSSVAVDQTPYNSFEPNSNGLPVGLSNPRVHMLSFVTNGTMHAKDILMVACDNIIARIESVRSLMHMIATNSNEHVLEIPGESDTIGNLFMRQIYEMYPDIPAVVYSTANVGRHCVIRCIYDDDITDLFGTVIKRLVEIFTGIRNGL